MADLSIFKLDSETITIKDTTARQAAESAKTLATTASDNATTALNKTNELESEITALNSSLSERYVYAPNGPVGLTNYNNSLLTFILAQYAKGYCAGDIALNGACTDSPRNDGWGYAVHWQMVETGKFIVTAVRLYTYKFFLREITDGTWETGWKASAAMTDVQITTGTHSVDKE